MRSGRRRNFEDEPRGRAPGLPWPAIISTVSAAAAVVVVAVLLFQRQDAWRHAPVPGVLGEPDAGRAPVTESKDNAAPPAEGEVPPSDQDEPPAAAGSGAAAPLAQGLDQGAAKLEPLAKEQDRAVGSAVGATVDERADRAAPRAEIRTESAEEALPDVAAQRQRSEKKASTDAPSAAASTSAPSPAGAENSYADIVARYGLPALYDAGRVRAAALLGAERDIRTLYQSGGAGADSARARLYLAEAARLRAGEDFDAETYDTIVHHYQRALRLAKDAETARVIRRRLEDFVSRSAPSR